ncbi:hypothetical protein C8Q77DRAFT_1274090 [Trametes polyzona]|nr:hypothetical protein C8Q77DRAFT_1274090 [Trametes polyzona]
MAVHVGIRVGRGFEGDRHTGRARIVLPCPPLFRPPISPSQLRRSRSVYATLLRRLHRDLLREAQVWPTQKALYRLRAHVRGGLSGGLRFFMSASPEEQEAAAAAGVSHPLNKIIRSLLDWFSAYYGVIQRKQELNEAEAARKAASVTAPEVPAPNPFFKTKSTREGWKLPPYTPGIIREGNEENDKQYWQYRESVSQYLSNHDAIKSLLNMYLRDVHLWPEDDKVADQIEKRVPKVMMRHVLTAKTKKGRSTRQNGADRAQSVKRKAGEMDAVAQQGRPKRRKSS